MEIQMNSVVENAVPVEEYFFEGAEKLLELWFTAKGNGSLRSIPRPQIGETE